MVIAGLYTILLYVCAMPGHFLNCFVAEVPMPTKSPVEWRGQQGSIVKGVGRRPTYQFHAALALDNLRRMALPVALDGEIQAGQASSDNEDVDVSRGFAVHLVILLPDRHLESRWKGRRPCV
jgi:hypothetical protein